MRHVTANIINHKSEYEITFFLDDKMLTGNVSGKEFKVKWKEIIEGVFLNSNKTETLLLKKENTKNSLNTLKQNCKKFESLGMRKS